MNLPGNFDYKRMVHPAGKYKCSNCHRDFNFPKLKKVGKRIVKHCPHCMAVQP